MPPSGLLVRVAAGLAALWACTAPPLAPARASRLRPKETTAPAESHWVHPCHQPGRDLYPGHCRTLAEGLHSGQPGRRNAAGRIRSDGAAGHSSIPGREGGAVLPSGAVDIQHGSTAGPLGAGWRGSAKPLRSMPLRLSLARADARLALLAPGQCSPAGRVVGVLRSTPAMAAPQGPVCEVRLLVVHRYQPGVQKLGTTPCEVEVASLGVV